MKRCKRPCALLFALMLTVLTLVGCDAPQSETGAGGGKTRFDKTYFEYFDTVCAVFGYEETEAAFLEKAALFEAEAEQYHRLYDIYHAYSGINNLKTVNDKAGIAPVAVDAKIIDLLERAVELHRLTGGKMNVMMGSVLSVWHEYRAAASADPARAAVPPEDVLRDAAAHTDIALLKIDRAAGTVYITDAEASLDVGAIAKGYAAEQIAVAMHEAGAVHYSLNLGGNIRTLGTRADGTMWSAGITDPQSESGGAFAEKVAIASVSLVTSGTYQRYYTVGDTRYHHIIDPETHFPAAGYASISVICRDSAMADALSTALFSMSLADGRALIASIPDTEALWISETGEKTMSDGFAAYIIK